MKREEVEPVLTHERSEGPSDPDGCEPGSFPRESAIIEPFAAAAAPNLEEAHLAVLLAGWSGSRGFAALRREDLDPAHLSALAANQETEGEPLPYPRGGGPS